MKRPLKDVRPIGPLAERGSSSDTVKINITVSNRGKEPGVSITDFDPSDSSIRRKLESTFRDEDIPIANISVETVFGDTIQVSTKKVLRQDTIINAMDMSKTVIESMGLNVTEVSVSC